MRKVLWLVDGDEQRFVDKALQIGADAICARTTNQWLKSGIKRAHDKGLKVYGWRWPAVKAGGNYNHHYAKDEADYVLSLIEHGLDGYIVDPECDSGRDLDCWNSSKWSGLAAEFSDKINGAGKAANPNFLYGLTSGCAYPTGFPHIPWQDFVERADALFPQVYWIGDHGPQHGGTPDAALDRSLKSWQRVSNGKPIIPIIGSASGVHPEDIYHYRELSSDHGIKEVHIYPFNLKVSDANWNAFAEL